MHHNGNTINATRNNAVRRNEINEPNGQNERSDYNHAVIFKPLEAENFVVWKEGHVVDFFSLGAKKQRKIGKTFDFYHDAEESVSKSAYSPFLKPSFKFMATEIRLLDPAK